MPGSEKRRGRERWLQWSLPVLSVAAVALVLELALIPFPVMEPQYFKLADEEHSTFRRMPGTTYTWSRGWNFKVVNQVRVNNHGWVSDQDYDMEATTPLLAVVGDSFVEAPMVPYERTCAGRLVNLLSSRGRVYSFGMSGPPLSHYLVYAQYVRQSYRPVGMVFVIVANDYLGSLIEYSHRYPFTYFAEGDAGETTLVTVPYVTNWRRDIAKKSNLLQYLVTNINVRGLIKGLTSGELGVMGELALMATERPDLLAAAKGAIDDFFELLPEMSGLAPAQIAFVVDGPRFPIYGEGEEATNAVQGSLRDLNRRYFMAGAEARGYEVLDMLPVFSRHWKANGERFDWPDDWHWNALGHGLCAEAVAGSALVASFGAGTDRNLAKP